VCRVRSLLSERSRPRPVFLQLAWQAARVEFVVPAVRHVPALRRERLQLSRLELASVAQQPSPAAHIEEGWLQGITWAGCVVNNFRFMTCRR
jgi:hypothetical protein